MKKTIGIFSVVAVIIIGGLLLRFFFTEEAQNKLNRGFTSLIGTKSGCMEFVSAGKTMQRFFNVEKLSTAMGTDDNNVRSYRYGYGYRDANLDDILSKSEKASGKKYFEISDFSQYIYYDKSN